MLFVLRWPFSAFPRIGETLTIGTFHAGPVYFVVKGVQYQLERDPEGKAYGIHMDIEASFQDQDPQAIWDVLASSPDVQDLTDLQVP